VPSGDFVLERPHQRVLRNDGGELSLRPRPLRALLLFVEHADVLLGKYAPDAPADTVLQVTARALSPAPGGSAPAARLCLGLQCSDTQSTVNEAGR
jgi:hypothetical protein